MENLFIKGAHDTYFIPEVILDADSGKCSISGESYLEEPYEFYQKIANWFNTYSHQKHSPVELNFKLTYFNTSSSRAILELLRTLYLLQHEGLQIQVNWFYPDPDDEEMLMEGEDFMEESRVTIQMVKYPR